jgi:hypothetical protein
MAKQLTLDEMIESLTLMNHPAAGTCQAVIEAIGTLMADTIAAALGVTAGPATFEGTAFAGTCAPFRPAFPGQPCPSPLSDYDPEEWDDEPHPSLAPAAEPSVIRSYTVETTIRRPFYKHRVYEAATPEDACRQALQDDDWEGEKLDDETAGEPYVTGVWTGEDAAYKSASLPIPTNGHASGEHKMQEVDLLLALLKRFASTSARNTLPHLDINS